MKQEVKIGQQDYTVLILVRDSTTGSPKTALTFESAGIDICYTRVETDNDVVLTAGAPVTTTLTGVHVDWGFVLVDDTNAPGLYKLDIADGVFAAGAWSAVVSFICTGCDPVHIEFVLVAYDKTDGVRMGLTALPNAAADAAGGLPISDAGALDLDAKIGALTFTVANKVDANALLVDGATPDDSADIAAEVLTEMNATPPKVDLDTIKTQAVTCAAGVTVLASVGTAAASTAQTGDSYASIVALAAKFPGLGTSGLVATDSPDTNSATSFKTNLTATSETDHWKDALLLFTSGDLAGQVKRITGYDTTTEIITVNGGFTKAPAEGDTFRVINQ